MARSIGLAMKRSTGGEAPRSSRQPPIPLDSQEVAKAAYGLFERRGRTHGHDLQDWLEAERIVLRRRTSNGR